MTLFVDFTVCEHTPIGRPARDATGGRAPLTLAIAAAPLGWPRPRSGTLGPRSGTLCPARHARASLSLLSLAGKRAVPGVPVMPACANSCALF